MKIFYRLVPQPAREAKGKLEGATKMGCLYNFLQEFGRDEVVVLGDTLDEETRREVRGLGLQLHDNRFKSGGFNFLAGLDLALGGRDNEDVYLVEDDFVHRPEARDVLLDGLSMGAAYVTLYDHPDKYVSPAAGGNPKVRHGGESTRLLLGSRCHWKVTNSTVMTFAAKVGQLRRDARVIRKYCQGMYPADHAMFRRLSWRGSRVISSVPGYATHAVLQWLTPLVDWNAFLCHQVKQ
jgi:hypothetical protein